MNMTMTNTHPHQRATLAAGTPPVVGRDGTGRGDGAHLPKGASVRDLLTELLDQVRRGECAYGQKRNLPNGQIYIFRIQSAGAPSPEERFKLCVQWMKDNEITNRRAFFAGCPEAGNSGGMHTRCIKQLKREGLIERIGREYVFKEG
jgi:hypothetical protein